jgi:hypothetical protein
MRRGAAALAALGAALFVFAAWATTASSIPIIRGVVPEHRDGGLRRHPTIEPPAGEKPPKERPSDSGLDLDLTIVLYALLITLLVALAFVLFRRVALRRRPRRLRREPAEAESEGDDWELAATEGLARSAARGLVALTEGEPRNAIVACWIELEDAVARIGPPRDPALTSEEFTSEVLQRYAIGYTEIVSLGVLYREARFSEHRMSERDRASAIEALTALRDGLRRAAPDLSAATTESQL